MAKTYHELIGSLGRGIFFRPERTPIRDLLSRDARPSLMVGDQEFPLYDVSMNGLSFLSRDEASSWSIGQELEITLSMHGDVMYRGRARIARATPGPRGSRIGLGLTTGFLDLFDVRRRDEEGRLAAELSGGAQETFKLVPPEYVQVMSKAVHFVQYYRHALDRHEARYSEILTGHSERVTELALQAAESMRGPWRDICAEASQCAERVLQDPAVRVAAKEYTETILTPLLLDAPMIHRAYTKPLGYPGDYQVMLFYYRNMLEGSSVFAKIFHKFFVEHPLSNGVRTRCIYVIDLMRDQHKRVTDRNGNNASYRVMSLGCGPGREVPQFITTGDTQWPGEIVWTLVDQEEETLSVAYHEGQAAIIDADANARLQCLNVSFAQVLNEPGILPDEPQDFIFSTGLFDYLSHQRAAGLIESLYGRLSEDGVLAIANALAPNDHSWSPEFILDWTLLYRTEADMRRLAERLPASAEVEVTVEPGNAYYFILIRKRPNS